MMQSPANLPFCLDLIACWERSVLEGISEGMVRASGQPCSFNGSHGLGKRGEKGISILWFCLVGD